MPMKITLENLEEDRCLCKVLFEFDQTDPKTYFVEVVYEVHRLGEDDFDLEGDPYFLERLSCTRTDTREPVTLLPLVHQEVTRAVIRKVHRENLWSSGRM